ncbi:DUF501 domain-containing protein [Paeniglutamicibacter antarcticus]|uniref:Ppx/GppA phosphatase N-terminal domain-containing protein n=1 Tax=Paeniglutamicibacter antarcticus TaxID=494023 RepID=A0ABP9TPC7_9MICC
MDAANQNHEALDAAARVPSAEDLETLSRQLNRPVRDVVEIGARCICGNPLVATTAPRLSSGIPFPTTYYLTHPGITAAVSRLEAAGLMNQMNTELGQDEALATHYARAHEQYLAVRDAIGERSGTGPVAEIAGVSAGGMPTRVKCLHVLVGHSLAAGPGVNPLGDRALEAIAEWWTPAKCTCAGAWDTVGPAPSQDRSRHVKTQAVDPAVKKAERAAARAAREAAATQDTQAPTEGASGHNNRVAAIDCGTNSIRLLIADTDQSAAGPVLTDVVREVRLVRLGQGVDATGEFADEALERTFAAIDEFAVMIREHGATNIRFVATSATRDARNRDKFVAGVRKRLGVDPEVVPGETEAALSFAGATSVVETTPGSHILVIDLGGGSTEFVLGDGNGPVASRSMDMGSVRLTERFWGNEMPTSEGIEAARAQVNAVIDEAQQSVDFTLVERIVGVAGTITTITAAALGLDHYDSQRIHGAEVKIKDLESSVGFLLGADRETRTALGYMHPGRVDVIAAGALIFGCILERVAQATEGRITTATASEHDILDGIALRLGRIH